MIKAIIFDFDGVILDSAHIKTNAFRVLFSQWPEIVDAAVEYHLNNTGVTRFVKFKYVYEQLLKKPYSDAIGQDLSAEFAKICFEEVKKAPLVDGIEQFLSQNNGKYKFFVASSSPSQELNDVIDSKGIRKYFEKIYGHPQLKKEVVGDILAANCFMKDEVVFIGDGESDLKAAEYADIEFVLRKTNENQTLIKVCRNKIDNFFQLDKILQVL